MSTRAKRITVILCTLMLCILAMAVRADNSTTDNSTHDESTNYTVDLGDGEGAILVFGDNNTIYLPPDKTGTGEVQPNHITVQGGNLQLVLTETDVTSEGVTTRFSKIVLLLEGQGWSVLWYEQ